MTIGVAANVATDAAGNNNTAATSKNVTVSVDTNAPGVSIAVPSGVQNGAFNVTITFTEAVSGFVGSDVSLTGSASSITSWSANSANTVYTATITPTTSGTVTLGVAANVATDAANNQNTAATSKTVTVDVDKPTVTIGVPSGTQTGAFDATITFSEAVSGFTQSDISLTGSAASITSWSGNSNNTVYTATITPTASGTVTIGVAANVATDAANNPNTAATSQTVTITLPETTPDPATWMPDANLRAAVRSALGIASNANFSKDDLSTLTSLRAVQAQVTNLTGLEYATGLTTLVAWGNQISSLTPIQNLTSLIEIRIGNNQISDVTPLDDLTSLTKLGIQHNNISDVTPLAGLVNLTWLRLAGNPISDLSPLVTLVKVTDSDVDLPEPDTTAPGVSISVPSGLQNGAFNATITFTETVSGFVQSEVSLTGSAASITSWSANNDNTVYTATIAPTASGTVTVGVAASVATDAASNPNTAATSKTVSVDIDKPTVTIGVPSGTQTGAFNATITFTETVSGFTQSEVSLTGSAASITSWSANSDNTVYTATITPTASGTVTVGVAANVATDAANNQNTTATSKTVSVDVDKPTVTIGVPSGTQTGAFDVTITFSETVSGFTQSDVSLSGSAASITGWSSNSDNTVYTATITLTASGTVTVGVAANVATDAANNPNAAATSQTVTVDVDAEPPGVSITVPSEAQRGAFAALITFTEAVSGFEQTDLSLAPNTAGATITTWVPGSDQTSYVVVITPTTSGEVTFNVAAGVATDAANNPNTAATSQTVTVDVDRPTVTIGVPSGTQTGAYDATITFSETVSGFTQSEVSLTGSAASITAWNANTANTVYTATITPTASGTITVGVAANVATDAANNPNTAATSQTVTVDVDAPTVTIGVPSDTQNGVFEATITFSETVSGFEQSEVSLSGSAASITSWSANSDDTVYTATITPTASGTVTVSVAASVATDAANNPNTAATSQTVSVDTDPPGVSISVPTGDQTNSFEATITFTETVSGFVQSDVTISGTANATITAWNTTDNITYTATITPATTGTVTLSVAAGVATDAADNLNTASETHTVTAFVTLQQIIDTDPPDVSITVPSGVQSSAFDVTVTFTEAVSGFEQAELSLTPNTAGAAIAGWVVSSDNTTYTATITPTTSGTVTLNVAASVATDVANNPNTAATAQTVTIQATVVTFTDTNLAAVVREGLGLDANAPITSVVLLRLTTLYATNSEISNLSGLEYATNLTALDLGWNSVSDIEPLSGLTNLTTLNLRSNQISDISHLENLTNLEELKLDGNQISDVSSLENLTNLTLLWLTGEYSSNTRISNISPLAGLTNLTYLALSWHQVSDISSLENLTNLTKLELGNNSISDISPLAGLTNLTYLTLIRNSISDISHLTGLTNLTNLYLGGNSISDISHLAGLTNLTRLDIGINQISDISHLAGLTKLTGLFLAFNRISDVTPLAGLVELERLTLRDNPILPSPPTALASLLTTLTKLRYKDIRLPDPDALIPDQGLARRVRAALDLAEDAEITEEAMLGLTSLSDAGHGWTIYSLAGLEHATNLTELRLNSYDISDISSLAGLVSLTQLDLGGNSLADDDITHLAGLTNLTYLQLYGNEISDISPLAGLTNLANLQLFKCDISDLSPLSNLTNLAELTLSDNPISDLSPLSGLTQLIYLNLYRCDISDINPLAGLVNLFALRLYDNDISDVTPIANLVELVVLKLKDNPISDTSPLYPLLEANGGKLRTVDIEISQYPPWDVNEDGSVDDTDSALVTAALGQSGTAIVNPRTDVNGDGTVDADDLTLVTDNLDSGAPSSMGLFALLDRETLETLDPAILEAQLEILRAQSDGSLKYRRAIALLESLLAALRPDETRLLANYPNPFNPETWIPYHLTNDSELSITIYDVGGTVVRRLELGHQRAGYYTSRSRAAYWDGRNEFGERVATGIYFYQLQADNMSLLRKMVILK